MISLAPVRIAESNLCSRPTFTLCERLMHDSVDRVGRTAAAAGSWRTSRGRQESERAVEGRRGSEGIAPGVRQEGQRREGPGETAGTDRGVRRQAPRARQEERQG